jgi:hypothetical protein
MRELADILGINLTAIFNGDNFAHYSSSSGLANLAFGDVFDCRIGLSF